MSTKNFFLYVFVCFVCFVWFLLIPLDIIPEKILGWYFVGFIPLYSIIGTFHNTYNLEIKNRKKQWLINLIFLIFAIALFSIKHYKLIENNLSNMYILSLWFTYCSFLIYLGWIKFKQGNNSKN